MSILNALTRPRQSQHFRTHKIPQKQAAILLEFCFQIPMGLIIRSSAIHAAGCYTTSPIAKGSLVVEYTGPIVDKEEADRRYDGKSITYLFAVGDGSCVIDGHGMAMFINHSCDANCETEEIEGRIWVCAIRDIAAGEEISYDYCLFDGDEQDLPCNCGAKNCRGSMFSPDELKRRRRMAAGPTIMDRTKRNPKSVSAQNEKHEAYGHGANGSQTYAAKSEVKRRHSNHHNGSARRGGKDLRRKHVDLHP